MSILVNRFVWAACVWSIMFTHDTAHPSHPPSIRYCWKQEIFANNIKPNFRGSHIYSLFPPWASARSNPLCVQAAVAADADLARVLPPEPRPRPRLRPQLRLLLRQGEWELPVRHVPALHILPPQGALTLRTLAVLYLIPTHSIDID